MHEGKDQFLSLAPPCFCMVLGTVPFRADVKKTTSIPALLKNSVTGQAISHNKNDRKFNFKKDH